MRIDEIRLVLPAWIAEEIDAAQVFDGDEARVALTIRLARRNIVERTGGPFGAAIFGEDGRVIAAGVNVVVPERCSVAHAEIVAFAAAEQRLGRARLNDDGRRYVLATSAQPCAMCYGASFWAGIDEMLIGARSSDVMAQSEFDEGPLPDDWIGELAKRGIGVKRDILRDEARALFALYAREGGARY
jgi:tRNA(Arg) A34 adenosine deaminase TadA